MGAWVITALPVGDNTNLRFQVLDAHAEPILAALREGEWEAKRISTGPRFCLSYKTEPASVYEVAFPMPRTPVWNDRVVQAELAIGDKKPDTEAELILKSLGYNDETTQSAH